MIEFAPLLFMLFNATPQMQVWIIDAFVEREVTWQYYQHPRDQRDVIRQGIGDCTDKAVLKCDLMRTQNISCRLAHGWVLNQRTMRYERHDFVEYNLTGTFVPIESGVIRSGLGIW